jgi:putative spermidine/putrescine transport system ATP-binding protein
VVKDMNDSRPPQLSAKEEVALAWLPQDRQALDRPDTNPRPIRSNGAQQWLEH